MERFCDELRWERERRQVSIETICEETKVASRHLLALEAGEYGALPGGVFRKGIVRSYLAALGLEEVSWIERFERRNRGGSEPRASLRWMGVAVMLGSLAALGWGVWKFALHGRLIP
jgi:cytoskeleton protein RodZ